MVQPRTSKPASSEDYSFRCPSCLNVLSVQTQMEGTTAPCPLCAASIVAPAPVERAIPLAQLVNNRDSPLSPVAGRSGADSRTRGRAILVDDKINRNPTDGDANSRILFFVILTVLFCALGAWLVSVF